MPTARLIQTSPDGLRLADVAAPAFQPDLPNWYQGQAIVLEPAVLRPPQTIISVPVQTAV